MLLSIAVYEHKKTVKTVINNIELYVVVEVFNPNTEVIWPE